MFSKYFINKVFAKVFNLNYGKWFLIYAVRIYYGIKVVVKLKDLIHF